VRPVSATMLVLLLEGESLYGIRRHADLLPSLDAGAVYPVRRVLEDCGPAGCRFLSEVIL